MCGIHFVVHGRSELPVLIMVFMWEIANVVKIKFKLAMNPVHGSSRSVNQKNKLDM